MAIKKKDLPDLKQIDKGLKDFQRKTAAVVFDRLYKKKRSSHRFLVADEVGLGKTLIARSVIARALHHLWDKTKRIDIIYICSNADIARQNIKRLNVLGDEGKVLPTRITLLPIKIKDLKKNRINFISFTPSTSFDLKSNLGVVNERLLLYWLLKDAWKFSGTPPMNVFQGKVQTKRFRQQIKSFQEYHSIDRTLAKKFRSTIRVHTRNQRDRGETNLRKRFQWLCQEFHRSDSKISPDVRHKRSKFIGELRNLLAETCVNMLEPDLVILDEFQRFKKILTGDDDTSLLARKLFEYEDNFNAVRVLLLSATPYKMYTITNDNEDEDHYKDFIDTLGFLFRNDRKVDHFSDLLRDYRYEFLRFEDGKVEKLESLKGEIQKSLRHVMARTERLAVTDDRAGMLTQVEPNDVELLASDILAYVELQSITHELDIPNTIEYWKSSSYLLNFMDDYKLKRVFHEALEVGDKRPAIISSLKKSKNLLLSWSDIEKYKALDPRNARLRGLLKQMINSDMWQLLWLPPSLPYYDLEGPFQKHSDIHTTKRLIFSNWRVVPKVISTILSYEAERKAVTLFDSDAINSEEEHKRRSHILLLRIAMTKGRPTGMPVLALMYPSISLAKRYDPLTISRELYNGEQPSYKKIQKSILDKVKHDLKQVLHFEDDGRVDEQWYWAAPILLDKYYFPDDSEEWLYQYNAVAEWTGEESEEDDARYEHVNRAQQLFNGELHLGKPPKDLADVITLLALGGPAICALRAMDRSKGHTLLQEVAARNAAAKVGGAFRSLFNRVEVIALLRGLKKTDPYWRRVLEYSAEGCLQSVLDEYVHILKDSLGLIGDDSLSKVDDIAEAIHTSLTVRSAALAVDEIRPRKNDVVKQHRLSSRYAMPFGQGRDDDSTDTDASRGQKVREAFNSPFWPFVITSTSIGQEGLDFHWYCHAIVHWNLPTNPVDLEQREGRVHRYKGHAVRKNVAKTFGKHGLNSKNEDPWLVMLNAAKKVRGNSDNDLVPYWIYPIDSGARIERYVPSLPLTRDRQLIEALKKSLAVYRLVFGQPRQDDLIAYLVNRFPKETLDDLVGRLRINLSP